MSLDELEQEIRGMIEVLAASTAIATDRAARTLAVEIGARILSRLGDELERIVAQVDAAMRELEQLRQGPAPSWRTRTELAQIAGRLELLRADARKLLELHTRIAAFVEEHGRELSPAVGEWLDDRELDEKRAGDLGQCQPPRGPCELETSCAYGVLGCTNPRHRPRLRT